MIMRTMIPKPEMPAVATAVSRSGAPWTSEDVRADLATAPMMAAKPSASTTMMTEHHSGDLVVVILIRSALRTAITVHLP